MSNFESFFKKNIIFFHNLSKNLSLFTVKADKENEVIGS